VSGGSPAAGQRPQGQGGQAGFNRQGGPQGSGQARPQMPRVWVEDKDGKLRMAMLRTGVSDTSYTEIVRSELKEGDVVLIGTATSTTAAANQQRPGGVMFMGGPPGGRR
ncbi:MAG: hypothetical protein WCC00_03555, partial [Candidatus Aminicenantales bacterium]